MPAGSLTHDLLGGAGLIEGADRHEAAAVRDGLGPHAPVPAPELLEGGLYAGAEHSVRLSVQREAALELRHGEGAVLFGDVDGDGGAGVRVADGVEHMFIGEHVHVLPAGAGVEHRPGLLSRERAEPNAQPSSFLCGHYSRNNPLCDTPVP